MNRIIQTIKNKTGKKRLLLFFILTLGFEVILGLLNLYFSNISNMLPLLDISFFYPISYARSYFENITEENISIFFKFIAIDMVFPIIYALFFSSLFAYLIKIKNRQNTTIEILIIIPFVVMLFDYIENVTMIFLIRNRPIINENLLWILTTASWLKWGITFTIIFIIIILSLSKKREIQ